MEFNWENLQIAKWGTKCNETCHLDKELAPLLVKPYTREPACSPPTRATPDSIGYDLYTAEELTIPPHSWALVPTGYIIKTLEGTYRRIAPRSRLALRHSIDIAVGVIDPDYRGEVKVLMVNNGPQAYTRKRNTRITQLILERAEIPDVVLTNELEETERQEGGFGSTGMDGQLAEVYEIRLGHSALTSIQGREQRYK
jgi:deoxyuridine 5'-triphosphate nucleotidohydrolase